MDYSELIDAIDRNNQSRANELLKAMIPRLKGFLKIHMNATKQDTEDCVQQALIKVLGAIREGKIRDKDSILSFTLSTCRNTYLNLLQNNKEQAYNDFMKEQTQKPRQLSAIIDKEQRKLLEWCIDQLSKNYKRFINFWFTHPNASAKGVATHFDISVNNAWTRKHRVMKKLADCYQKRK